MKFHNTSFPLILMMAFLAIANLNAFAFGNIATANAASQLADLKTARNNTDSIKILLDIYSFGDKVQRDMVRKQLINLAATSDNHEVIEEVVNELSTSTDDASELSKLIKISESLPKKEEKQPMVTVLEMAQAQAEAPNVADSQLKEQIASTKRLSGSLTGDPYKEIQNIYRTLVYLGASSQGPMYLEYIKRLEELVESLPQEDYAIKNLYYTTAAIFYTRKRDYDKAIEFDQKLIKELDQMKEIYKKAGKDTSELDYFYYVSYRRMLRNFRGLSLPEIEEAYQKCVEIAEINPEAKEAFDTGGLTKSYYYFATEQYPQALPEIKKALAVPDISDFRKQELLGLLAYSYQMTGNKDGELEALREYTLMSLADREKRLHDTYRELDLRNSVNKVIAEELQDQEKQREENKVMRKTALTLVYVLAVILIFLCSAYFRMRQKLKTLESKNIKLRQNIEYIFDDGVPKGTQKLQHHKNRLKG